MRVLSREIKGLDSTVERKLLLLEGQTRGEAERIAVKQEMVWSGPEK